MKRCALALGLALLACSDSHRDTQRSIDEALAQSLIGSWDANLSLIQPYPLGPSEPASRRICGTIGFVENRRVHRGEERNSVGVYDLDLSRLGLNWLGDDSFPNAVASSPRGSATIEPRQSDSVSIVLNPGSNERIVLLGRHDGSGFDGSWFAQSARGTATGLFSLRPHAESARHC